MGQLQGVAAAIAGGSHLGKQQNQNHLVLQRPQQVGTTTQDKVIGGVAAQKQQQNSAQKQQGGMQRVHPRSSNPGGGWQQQPPVVALGGQHGHVSPAGQSRLFYQHPVLNSQQPRSSPQEQGQGQGQVRQHLGLVGVPPQQYAMPQQQMRDGGVPTGSKSVPVCPYLSSLWVCNEFFLHWFQEESPISSIRPVVSCKKMVLRRDCYYKINRGVTWLGVMSNCVNLQLFEPCCLYRYTYYNCC